jgi:secreted trypsin-like serine protease
MMLFQSPRINFIGFFQGIGCGTENLPGIYVKVSLFRNWIDQQFDKKGLEKEFYIA